jgi:hypothetical protein
MMLLGLRLLINPKRAWHVIMGAPPRKAAWLIAAALTAAVWPAVAVVLGHIGSAALGLEEASVATLRAVVGFMSVVGGALVMAPALSLILIWLTGTAHENTSANRAGTVAMCIVWPTWASGMVLAVPPLFGLGPELGEVVWVILASLVALRTIRLETVSALAIRRRWKLRFISHTTAAFIFTFAAVSIAPAMTIRSMLGASTLIMPSTPDRPPLPLPPPSDW